MVDANILVRAVLGKRVRDVIAANAGNVSFFVPETAFAQAEEHVAALAVKRDGDPQIALAFLRSLSGLVELIGCDSAGVRLGARLPHLDRGHRFLRVRRRHVDNGSGPDVLTGVGRQSEVARN